MSNEQWVSGFYDLPIADTCCLVSPVAHHPLLFTIYRGDQ
jgi:hypothetical protein